MGKERLPAAVIVTTQDGGELRIKDSFEARFEVGDVHYKIQATGKGLIVFRLDGEPVYIEMIDTLVQNIVRINN